MKMNLKATILAVVAALGFAGEASADLVSASSGNSALIFSAWDSATNASYSRALGLNLNDFATSTAVGSFPTNLSFASDGLFTSLFGSSITSSTFQWNVIAADSNTLTSSGPNDTSAVRNRIIATSQTQTPTTPTRGQNANSALNMDTYLGNLAAGVPGLNGNTGSGGSTNLGDNWNINNAASVWGATLGPSGFYNTAGAIGQSLFFFLTSAVGSNSNDVNTALSFGGSPVQWKLASNGTLTWDPQVASVPVPAAVWLLGSGLMGLIGVARRRDGKKGGNVVAA